jgi:hypothetical protein
MDTKRIISLTLWVIITINSFSQPADNVAAYYSFSGDGSDGASNGHDATITGATLTSDRLGKSNAAYSFNGTNNLIYLPSNILPTGCTALCLSFWFKSYGVGNFNGQILVDLRGQYNFAISYQAAGTTYQRAVVFYTASSTGSVDCSSVNNVIQDGVWYHVVANYGNNTAELYINGNLVNTKTQAPPTAVSGYNSTVGKDYQGQSSNRAWFYGAIDEVVIYKRSLASDEIVALYNKGLSSSETFGSLKHIRYTYDESGNRTSRNVIVLKSASYITQRDSGGIVQTSGSGLAGETYEENIGKQNIKIYPNPTKGVLLVETEGYEKVAPEKTALYVYSFSGKQLFTKTYLNSSFTVDLSNYPNGIYLLKLILGDTKSEWKIIKE